MTIKPRAIVAGGGPVGLYTAHALAKANIDYVVLEQQPEIVRYKGAALVLFPQSTRLLDQIGLYAHAQKLSVRLHSKVNMLQNGQQLARYPLFQPLEENHGYESFGFSRSDLIQILYENLPERDSRIKTNARVVDIETRPDGVRVHLEDGSVEEGTLLIGADGVHSRTREIMGKLARESTEDGENEQPHPMVTHFQAIFGRATSGEGMEKGLFVESHGTGLATQAVAGNEYTYFSVLRALPKPTTARRRFNDQDLEEEVKKISDIYIFPNITFGELWEASADKSNASLVQMEEGHVDKWYHGRIVLLGDAVHKMTSINGLGVNTGLQSAAVLVNQLQSMLSSSSDWGVEALEKAFQQYQSIQEPVSRGICMQGSYITRLITWSTWTQWIFDRYIMPWMRLENQVRQRLSPLISNSHVLEFVPFESKSGQMPWVREPKEA